jgi:hypothetical protein
MRSTATLSSASKRSISTTEGSGKTKSPTLATASFCFIIFSIRHVDFPAIDTGKLIWNRLARIVATPRRDTGLGVDFCERRVDGRPGGTAAI